MALKGNLRDFSVTQLLNLVNVAQKTGTLVVERPSERVWLSFREGKLSYAQAGNEDGSLVSVLYQTNRISAVQYKVIKQRVLVYVSWAIVLASVLVVYRTPFGLRLRGTGLGAATIASLGLRPRSYQLAGILISGFTCGLAGAGMSLNLAAFVPNITSGRGWIALVAIYLGNKTPLGIVVASFVFGLAEAFSNYAQGALEVPADFILAFPYAITVLAMILFSIWRHSRARAR